ncbi:hypothetical protein DFA_02922 [Cavenderia fasciculata]|uniref:Uncharacterized protein n=1 Tax=Cavenderia fasciculata TaxID=261658 RepID=F4PG44_CACFS|nr:uncharacterized protein DFA_02922 [Cavenderia fasciculata]EGG24678.1 hypothetical protein DFA_02922 [Cavenderia fasciculata]|eukprot:XP_004362529.1 hypothetical protein DFA_02922 [Cavenderia fasciculata]
MYSSNNSRYNSRYYDDDYNDDDDQDYGRIDADQYKMMKSLAGSTFSLEFNLVSRSILNYLKEQKQQQQPSQRINNLRCTVTRIMNNDKRITDDEFPPMYIPPPPPPTTSSSSSSLSPSSSTNNDNNNEDDDLDNGQLIEQEQEEESFLKGVMNVFITFGHCFGLLCCFCCEEPETEQEKRDRRRRRRREKRRAHRRDSSNTTDQIIVGSNISDGVGAPNIRYSKLGDPLIRFKVGLNGKDMWMGAKGVNFYHTFGKYAVLVDSFDNRVIAFTKDGLPCEDLDPDHVFIIDVNRFGETEDRWKRLKDYHQQQQQQQQINQSNNQTQNQFKSIEMDTLYENQLMNNNNNNNNQNTNTNNNNTNNIKNNNKNNNNSSPPMTGGYSPKSNRKVELDWDTLDNFR